MRDHKLLNAVVERPSTPMDATTTAVCLQALFEHSPVAIVAMDSENRFVMCNLAFEALFQFSPEELSTTDPDDLIAGPDLTEEARSLSQAVLRGEKVHTVTQRRRKDGMMVDVEIYGIPLMVEGALSGVYGLYQDVTERNHAQTAFRQITLMLSNLQQEERRRIARDLHDSLSQDLAVLNWNLTLLMKMVSDKDVTLHELAAQTKDIAMQCSSQIRTTSYLLHPPLLGEEGLQPVVSRLAKEFEQRSGIQVTLDLPLDLRRFADVVEITVFRVLQEALANVLRHSGSPAVHLSLCQRSGWLTLVVSDKGKLSGARSGVTKDSEHSGVGVSGMRERLEELGGYLRIAQTDLGTTVVAALPIEGD